MAHILIAYHSETGNTEQLSRAVEQGVSSVNGLTCIRKRISEVTLEDLQTADGVIVGSPTYFGLMSAEVKKVFDITEKIYGAMEGKVGAAFTTSGGYGSGHETTNMSIITAMLISGMIVQGTTAGPCYGPFSAGKPNEEQMEQAVAMGKKTAELTKKLHQ